MIYMIPFEVTLFVIDLLPDTEVVFSTLWHEEKRRNTLLNQGNMSQVAMAARKSVPLSVKHHSSVTNGDKCSHCGSDKHLVDSCFKKNGYPDWWNDHKERLQARGKGKIALCTVSSSSLEGTECVNNSPVIDSTKLQKLGTQGKAFAADRIKMDY